MSKVNQLKLDRFVVALTEHTILSFYDKYLTLLAHSRKLKLECLGVRASRGVYKGVRALVRHNGPIDLTVGKSGEAYCMLLEAPTLPESALLDVSTSPWNRPVGCVKHFEWPDMPTLDFANKTQIPGLFISLSPRIYDRDCGIGETDRGLSV